MPDLLRIDKWLWATRCFKTRSQAAEACRNGHIRIQDHPAKPSRDVRVGDTLSVRSGPLTRTLRIRALPERRLAAARLPEFLEDLTPPEALEQARPTASPSPQRPHGTGRPTKRDRRRLDQWLTPPSSR
ncbi:MAG: RNA-binding S4 domain-containing protein [Verrucomicrobiae bacterium]|nr:RNA-binding S4 domain-containing protein [Verrucomicrobiae bacterium]